MSFCCSAEWNFTFSFKCVALTSADLYKAYGTLWSEEKILTTANCKSHVFRTQDEEGSLALTKMSLSEV